MARAPALFTSGFVFLACLPSLRLVSLPGSSCPSSSDDSSGIGRKVTQGTRACCSDAGVGVVGGGEWHPGFQAPVGGSWTPGD